MLHALFIHEEKHYSGAQSAARLETNIPQHGRQDLNDEKDDQRAEVEHAAGREHLPYGTQDRFGNVIQELDNGIAAIHVGEPTENDAREQEQFKDLQQQDDDIDDEHDFRTSL